MNKTLFKEIMRSISRSKTRFISIIAIVALGISFFAGIKATAPDMKETAELYFKDSNLMDIRVISPIGLTDDDITAFNEVEGVETVMPSRFVDGILKADGKSIGDIDGSEMTCRALSLNFNDAKEFEKNKTASSDYMNRVTLIEGQWPSAPNECVVDCSALSAPEQFKIGQTFSLCGDGTNIENKLSITEFKIVGIVRTPTYISFERGNTNIGSGKLGTFIYVSDEVFNFDYYTEAYISVAGADNYSPYSQEYDDLISSVLNQLHTVENERLPIRAEELRMELEPKVTDGKAELEEKQAEFDKKVIEGENQVAQLKDLAENGREEIKAKEAEFNDSLFNSQTELNQGTNEYNKNYKKWRKKQDELNQAKLQLAKLESAQNEYNRAAIILDNSKIQLATAEHSVATLESLVVNTKTALDYFQDHQNQSKEELQEWLQNSGLPADQINKLLGVINGFTAVGTAEEMIAYLEPMLDDYIIQLEESRNLLAEAKAEYQAGEKTLAQAKEELKKYEGAKEEATAAEIELAEVERELNSASLGLELGQHQLTLSHNNYKVK